LKAFNTVGSDLSFKVLSAKKRLFVRANCFRQYWFVLRRDYSDLVKQWPTRVQTSDLEVDIIKLD